MTARFPVRPNLGDKHTSCGETFYWCGTDWVKPGTHKSNITHYDNRDPTDKDTNLAYGSNWVNLADGTSFEYITPGLWRPLSPEPSIQFSSAEPKTQSNGLPLVTGDLWVNRVDLSMSIYSERDNAWYNMLASVSNEVTTRFNAK